MTYNHSNYIQQALDGFCFQKTIFPYICIIVDDASTDGAADVIKKYVNDNFVIVDPSTDHVQETEDFSMHFVRHRCNCNCFFVVFYLKYNHYLKKDKTPYYIEWEKHSKYIAICEGDDFWTCSSKLQKQVDFLENHSDYVLTYSNYRRVDKCSNTLPPKYIRKHGGKCLKALLLKGNFIQTLTVCYRRESMNGFEDLINEMPFNLLMGDKPMWLYLSGKGKFKYFKRKWASYRVISGSVSHPADPYRLVTFFRNAEEISHFFNNYYKAGVPSSKIDILYLIIQIAIRAKYLKDTFVDFSKQAIKKYPSILLSYKFWFFLCVYLYKYLFKFPKFSVW